MSARSTYWLGTRFPGSTIFSTSDQVADQRSGTKKSPNPKRRFSTRGKVEEEGSSTKLLSTKNGKEPPKRKCPIGCAGPVAYGSAEFCTGFDKKEILDRKKLVKAKYMCT